MRLRNSVFLLAGLLAAWPVAATGQVSSTPVIGFLHAQSSGPSDLEVAKFREGLNEEGYVEGRNVVIEYRWGNNDPSTLPALAADLVQHRVAVIVAADGTAAAVAAKAATPTIPIVFMVGADPVELGFVESLR